ncbi:group I truncated hemoglobin [Salinithrix halophila]|uniref:Group 1 truncated hemoglobin n=1 Tax=Salinithrix halophila TaxID=1485204 RepID=A0ABV8JDF4_9BACL
MPPHHELSLYELLGDEGVSAVVNDFYDRVIQDPRLNHYFQGMDMNRLRQHQMHFLVTYALGGPEIYKGPKLSLAHRNLHITDSDYEQVIRHLNRSLIRFEVPLEIRIKIEAFIRGIKPHIINK